MRHLQAVVLLLAAASVGGQEWHTGDALPCVAQYLDSSSVAITGLSVTVDVYRAGTEILTAQAATELGDGLYGYTVASGSVTATGTYVCVFHEATNGDGALAFNVTTDTAERTWDVVVASHSTGGSTGAALSAAGSGADPLLNAVPGAYASGSAGAALGRIGTATISVSSPVDTVGNLTLTEGADQVADWDNSSGTWSDLTGATVTLYASAANADGTDFTHAVTVVTPTGSQKIRLTLTDTEADALQPGVHSFQVWATLSGGAEELLVRGAMTVRADLR